MRALPALALVGACWAGTPVRQVEFVYVRPSPDETSVCRGSGALEADHPVPAIDDFHCDRNVFDDEGYYYCLYNQYLFYTGMLEYWVQSTIRRCRDQEVLWTE